jgi:hypothetical protein
MRQWVLRVPFPLRFLFAGKSEVMTRVLGLLVKWNRLMKCDLKSCM